MGELPNLPLCYLYVIIIISTQFFTLLWLGSAVACGENTVARLVCACSLTPKCESLFAENVGACLAHTEVRETVVGPGVGARRSIVTLEKEEERKGFYRFNRER